MTGRLARARAVRIASSASQLQFPSYEVEVNETAGARKMWGRPSGPMPLSLWRTALPANFLVNELISNVMVIVAALRFGGEQFAVDFRGDVKIVIISTGPQSNLQDLLFGNISDPSQGRRIQFQTVQAAPRFHFDRLV